MNENEWDAYYTEWVNELYRAHKPAEIELACRIYIASCKRKHGYYRNDQRLIDEANRELNQLTANLSPRKVQRLAELAPVAYIHRI